MCRQRGFGASPSPPCHHHMLYERIGCLCAYRYTKSLHHATPRLMTTTLGQLQRLVDQLPMPRLIRHTATARGRPHRGRTAGVALGRHATPATTTKTTSVAWTSPLPVIRPAASGAHPWQGCGITGAGMGPYGIAAGYHSCAITPEAPHGVYNLRLITCPKSDVCRFAGQRVGPTSPAPAAINSSYRQRAGGTESPGRALGGPSATQPSGPSPQRLSVRSLRTSHAGLTDDAFEQFKRDVAARVIQAQWRRWQAWRTQVGSMVHGGGARSAPSTGCT